MISWYANDYNTGIFQSSNEKALYICVLKNVCEISFYFTLLCPFIHKLWSLKAASVSGFPIAWETGPLFTLK